MTRRTEGALHTLFLDLIYGNDDDDSDYDGDYDDIERNDMMGS